MARLDAQPGRTVKALIWDFDGTLAYRQGGRWAAALLEVIREVAPDNATTEGEIRPYLQSGFPWLTPDRPHPGIRSRNAWWQAAEPIFVRAFRGVGFGRAQASRMAACVRPVYVNPARWYLYDDVLPTLERLSAQGWSHLMLSNHVPELRDIAGAIGLLPHFKAILNSAETGYEKPHPGAFQAALDAARGATDIWMIGDSPTADVAGARAMGIPAILVRGYDETVERSCDTLACIPAIVDPSGDDSVEGI